MRESISFSLKIRVTVIPLIWLNKVSINGSMIKAFSKPYILSKFSFFKNKTIVSEVI